MTHIILRLPGWRAPLGCDPDITPNTTPFAVPPVIPVPVPTLAVVPPLVLPLAPALATVPPPGNIWSAVTHLVTGDDGQLQQSAQSGKINKYISKAI
jgi:hypothetical protein